MAPDTPLPGSTTPRMSSTTLTLTPNGIQKMPKRQLNSSEIEAVLCHVGSMRGSLAGRKRKRNQTQLIISALLRLTSRNHGASPGCAVSLQRKGRILTSLRTSCHLHKHLLLPEVIIRGLHEAKLLMVPERSASRLDSCRLIYFSDDGKMAQYECLKRTLGGGFLLDIVTYLDLHPWRDRRVSSLEDYYVDFQSDNGTHKHFLQNLPPRRESTTTTIP